MVAMRNCPEIIKTMADAHPKKISSELFVNLMFLIIPFLTLKFDIITCIYKVIVTSNLTSYCFKSFLYLVKNVYLIVMHYN